jgi:hypothetical protein
VVKRLLAVAFLVAGVGGVFAAAPRALADQTVSEKATLTVPSSAPSDLCLLRVNVTVFGHHVGTGKDSICL